MGLDMLETIERLRVDNPVYLNVSSGVDYREQPLTTMEAIVDDHLRMIRRIQRRGPYLLLGYSLGAQIAVEMARKLAREGDTVRFLAGIDPQLNEAHWPFSVWLEYSRRRLAHHVRRMRRMQMSEVGAYAMGRLLPLAGRFGRALNAPLAGPPMTSKACRG
jgi:thioesterase domain-containing protein